MSIMGFIVHTLPESCAEIEKSMSNMAGITTYGIHHDCYIVAVAEAPSSELEATINTIKQIENVLTCYVTSLDKDPESETD